VSLLIKGKAIEILTTSWRISGESALGPHPILTD
jgi:hypothetical protein